MDNLKENEEKSKSGGKDMKSEIAKKEKWDLVELDFANVFVRREGDILLNPFYAKIKLSEKNGHIYSIKGKYAITSTGYIQLNKIASVNLVTPQMVMIDGVARPNPHVERNAKTKVIETVNVRKIAVGYSPVGNITIIDKTLFYNVYTYFIQSIQSKMKKNAKCAFVGTKEDQPTKSKSGKWAWYETADPLGIWVDYTNSLIIDALEDHTQRQRFGDRIAQKIVERNLLKDHPAIGISQPDVSQGIASVLVYGWKHKFRAEEIQDISAQAERGSPTIKAEKEIIDIEPEEEEKIVEETKREEGEDTKNGTLFNKEVKRENSES